MMKLLPILLPIIGLVGGLAAAELLAPAKKDGMKDEAAEGAEMADADAEGEAMAAKEEESEKDEAMMPADGVPLQAVSLDRRLLVPMVTAREAEAIILIDVAVEVPETLIDVVHNAKPRLRDAFLRRMLSLSAGGAFRKGVADPQLIDHIRQLLTEEARKAIPGVPSQVLVLEVILRKV